MPDSTPRPSLLTRLVAWLLGLLKRRDAQAAADVAATTRNQDAADAAHAAQASAPDSRAQLVRSVRSRADF